MMSCLSDGHDHSPCCLDNGVPELCSDLCSGGILLFSLISQIILPHIQETRIPTSVQLWSNNAQSSLSQYYPVQLLELIPYQGNNTKTID